MHELKKFIQRQIRDVYRSWGDLPHDTLRDQVALILFSGLCMNFFAKLKGYIIKLEKGCSLLTPQVRGKPPEPSSYLMCYLPDGQ